MGGKASAGPIGRSASPPPNVPYSLASISKPMTATGLMVLADRGLIRLDAPMDDYLGAAKLRARTGSAREATVRRVASHSAGLPLHYQFFYADESYARPPMDETILRYANLVTPPGERYQYSNLGYGLLDYAISRVSGRDYAEFMRNEVFLPLGLTRTSVHLTPALEPYAATRYSAAGQRLPMYDFDHPGGSALWADAHDLVRFGMFPQRSTSLIRRPSSRTRALTRCSALWPRSTNRRATASAGFLASAAITRWSPIAAPWAVLLPP